MGPTRCIIMEVVSCETDVGWLKKKISSFMGKELVFWLIVNTLPFLWHGVDIKLSFRVKRCIRFIVR